jgi:hypothetical protein
VKSTGTTASWVAWSCGAGVAFRAYRRWHLHWGATGTEANSAYPGDHLIAQPRFAPTRALTINAPPEQVWPWIVQIGIGRAGFYSLLERPARDRLAAPHGTRRLSDDAQAASRHKGTSRNSRVKGSAFACYGASENLSPSTEAPAPSTGSSVELLWIPLGAGQRIVKHSGKAFESICALIERRPVCDIYHAALVVTVPYGRYTIGMAPIPDRQGARRGVVAEGPVGHQAGTAGS